MPVQQLSVEIENKVCDEIANYTKLLNGLIDEANRLGIRVEINPIIVSEIGRREGKPILKLKLSKVVVEFEKVV